MPGLGLGIIDQTFPFQNSVRVRMLLPSVVYPTVIHMVVLKQEMPSRRLLPLGLGLETTVHEVGAASTLPACNTTLPSAPLTTRQHTRGTQRAAWNNPFRRARSFPMPHSRRPQPSSPTCDSRSLLVQCPLASALAGHADGADQPLFVVCEKPGPRWS